MSGHAPTLHRPHHRWRYHPRTGPDAGVLAALLVAAIAGAGVLYLLAGRRGAPAEGPTSAGTRGVVPFVRRVVPAPAPAPAGAPLPPPPAAPAPPPSSSAIPLDPDLVGPPAPGETPPPRVPTRPAYPGEAPPGGAAARPARPQFPRSPLGRFQDASWDVRLVVGFLRRLGKEGQAKDLPELRRLADRAEVTLVDCEDNVARYATLRNKREVDDEAFGKFCEAQTQVLSSAWACLRLALDHLTPGGRDALQHEMTGSGVAWR